MKYHPQPISAVDQSGVYRLVSRAKVIENQVVLHPPPLPDYVPGPEEPEQAPPLPDFVPELVYPEFMPPDDEVLPDEEQPPCLLLHMPHPLLINRHDMFLKSDPERFGRSMKRPRGGSAEYLPTRETMAVTTPSGKDARNRHNQGVTSKA
ncbi:hypothetical protein Tco_0230897 [Tanacetum coccineum]